MQKQGLCEKYRNLDRVTLAAFAFLLLFTAFNSADNLAAKVLREDGFEALGFYSMTALYLVFALTGFFSKAIVHKISGAGPTKRLAMAIGGLCYFLRIVCFLLPAAYHSYPHDSSPLPFYLNQGFIAAAIILTAMLNGFGGGILWVAQGEYVTSCATEETKGFYFSYFFIIFMIS
jgi:hypothetical protein